MSDLLVVARASPAPNEPASVEFDLTEVNKAEARLVEIAGLTPSKAPELMATMNTAFSKASKATVQLQYEKVRAKRYLDRLEAQILLDRVPKIMADRGLATTKSPAGSEDLRKAVVQGEADYQLACEVLDRVTAMHALVAGKARALEMAYSNIKAMVGENSFNWAGNRNTNHHEQGASSPPASGFGKPNLKGS